MPKPVICLILLDKGAWTKLLVIRAAWLGGVIIGGRPKALADVAVGAALDRSGKAGTGALPSTGMGLASTPATPEATPAEPEPFNAEE